MVAVIPGEVVQVIAGVMYGTWGGLALCVFGCVLASALVFVVVRKLGRDFVVRLFGESKINSMSFLNDSTKLETLVFILFLDPGPAQGPAHLRGAAHQDPPRQVPAALQHRAHIPGVVASTIIGSSFADTNWALIIGVFAVVIVVGGLSIWKRDALMGWAKRCGGVGQPACEVEANDAAKAAGEADDKDR